MPTPEPTLTTVPHLRRRGRLDDVHHAEDIGLEDLADRLSRSRLEDRDHGNAGIVDDRVETAETVDAGLDSGFDAGRIGDVEGGDQDAAGICVGQFRIRLAHGGYDVPALFREMAGGHFSEARRAAGDENGLGHVSVSNGLMRLH